MSDDKKQEKVQEIDVASLDSELAAAKKVEEGKNSRFVRMAAIVALCMSLFHVYTGFFGLFEYVTQRGIHLAFGLTLIILTMPLYEHVFGDKFAQNKSFRVGCRIFDIALILAVWVAVFMARDEVNQLAERAGGTTILAIVAGCILFFAVLEAARRSLGYIMPVLALIFVAYALAGPYLPMSIAHRGYNFTRIFKFLATDLDGMFGTTLSVSSTVIFMFILFGAFLESSGCSEFINKIALSITGRVKAGPALSAVVASALMGTVNGSAVANVVGTGTFTIPLMKSRGYKPQFAGGVEAVSSTGGQILPPVMGAGAFLMVAFTGVSYFKIVVAAVLPAVMYFFGCAFAVISQSEINPDIIKTPEDQIPKSKEVLKSGWFYILIIAVLIYFLMVVQISPLRSALYAAVSIPLVMIMDKQKRFTIKSIIPSLEKAGFASMTIVIGCACAGIVVAMVSLTGIGVVFGDMMIGLAHNLLFPSLVFTAMACVILGMGLPTTSAYVIAASILAPALTKLHLPLLTAHLFVFYYACLSAITPPVALAAYAGAGIAKCSPMTTAVEACKIGFAGFIVPFIFCYEPAFMMQGPVSTIIIVAIASLLGTFYISVGFQGWLLVKLNILERLLLMIGGVLMFVPTISSDIAGLAVLGVVTAMLYIKKKKADKLAA
jgi:TRAP transporter 4TM/12TM fusion protein